MNDQDFDAFGDVSMDAAVSAIAKAARAAGDKYSRDPVDALKGALRSLERQRDAQANITPGLIVWATGPLDYWDGMIHLKNFASAFAEEFEGDHFEESPKQFQQRIIAMAEEAQMLATHVGWEGDIIQGPYLTFLPDPANNQTFPVFAWKQQNNGSTFVASVRPLHHMDGEGFASVHYKNGLPTSRTVEF